MHRYSAAVVGGGTGGRLSLAALANSDRFDLQAACDVDPAVCHELGDRFPGLCTFTDHRALFAECPTDVVCVSTWPPSHVPIARCALELPITGLLVEKPLADTTAAAAQLLAAIEARRLPLVVPHGLLVARHAGEIVDRVRGGEIGELRLVSIECDKWDIINAGIHWLNFFVTLTADDPVRHVLAQCDVSTRTYRDGMQVETAAVTYLETNGGVRLVMHTGDFVNTSRAGKSTVFRLVGTGGHIEFWAWESAYLLLNAAYPSGKLFTPEPHQRPAHQLHLERLAAQMDAAAADYGNARSSLAALELVEAAYRSHHQRCAISLPLAELERPEHAGEWLPGRPYGGSGGGRDGRKLA